MLLRSLNKQRFNASCPAGGRLPAKSGQPLHLYFWLDQKAVEDFSPIRSTKD